MFVLPHNQICHQSKVRESSGVTVCDILYCVHQGSILPTFKCKQPKQQEPKVKNSIQGLLDYCTYDGCVKVLLVILRRLLQRCGFTIFSVEEGGAVLWAMGEGSVHYWPEVSDLVLALCHAFPLRISSSVSCCHHLCQCPQGPVGHGPVEHSS